MKKVWCSILVLALVSCGGTGPAITTVVHADTPTTLQLNCPVNPDIPLQDPQGGTLKLHWGECAFTISGSSPITAQQSGSLVLTSPVKSVLLESWIGTPTNSAFEIGVSLTVHLPDGRVRYFVDEFDKHSPAWVGEQWHRWQLPLSLPAGTRLELLASAGIHNPVTDCPSGCAFETVWIFNDGII